MADREGEKMDAPRRSQPPSLGPLTAIFQESVTDPDPGEIWRAAWKTSVQLVLITAVGDDDVDAVPVSPDVEFADDRTVRIHPGPPLTHGLGAWCGLQRRLPVRVLDVRISTITADDLGAVRAGNGIGPPITSVLDERDQVRDALAGRLAALADATWLPSSSDAVDLADRVRERGLKPSQLALALDVAPGDVTDLLRADRGPTPRQAEILGPILDLEPSRLLAVHVDPDLVWALDRPRYRRRLAERGIAEGHSDEAAWRLQVATGRLPVAARTTGAVSGRRRWSGLIETFLDER